MPVRRIGWTMTSFWQYTSTNRLDWPPRDPESRPVPMADSMRFVAEAWEGLARNFRLCRRCSSRTYS